MFRSFCRVPKNTKSLSAKGACPELLDDLLKELDGAKEVHIAAYLFNNMEYCDKLIDLAKKGCKVSITSIPIWGYSTTKKKVSDIGKVSAQELAEEVYNKLSQEPNIRLYIFNHMYVWYKPTYSTNSVPYSFHIKAVTIELEDVNKCIISSGNFKVTDPPHSDNLLVIENEAQIFDIFKQFMSVIENKAEPYNTYKQSHRSIDDDFSHVFKENPVNLGNKETIFTAPFVKVNGVGSNHYAGNRICDMIEKADKQVLICAQHFHDVLPYDDSVQSTILGALTRLRNNRPGVDIKVLKQVASSGLADKRRAAITETYCEYKIKVEQKINKLTHDKFIIVDDAVIVTSANFTPTQFVFAERNMSLRNGVIRKYDVFSEVNGFVIVRDQDVYKNYKDHFDKLWSNGEKIHIKI